MPTLDPQTAAPQAAVSGGVVCVVDRSEHALEAVRQAAHLAGAGGELELVALAADPAPGRPRPQAAQIEALVEGSAVAARHGVRAAVHIEETADEVAAVLGRCRGRGLLVVPDGPLAAAVLARAEGPVLVARPVPRGAGFPGSVVIAVDGSPEAHEATLLGARLAAHEHALAALVASPEHDAGHQHALASDAATVERITGRRPLILDEYGPPATSIVAAATSLEASLIVLGSRPGRQVASVSAEVAERAGCSVLVLRPGPAVSRPAGARA
jgi:hypothetical protein